MNQQVLQAIVASIDNRESVALISVTEADGAFAGNVGHHAALWLDATRAPVGDLALGELTEQIYTDARRALDDRKHRRLDYTTTEGSLKIFVEVQAQPPHLIIVGAGHIAVPLAAVAKLNDFEVTVLDDRPLYANVARFPSADRVIAGPFRAELSQLRGGKPTFDNHTYVVLVTRGHQYDIDSLLEVLDDPLAYIGMIGSQRRIRAVFELLEKDQGIPAAKFDRIYAPIGIDIGARTPAEIAICIMAEMINVMRKGPALSMSEQIRRERIARRERAQEKTL
ncbi:MAG: XdhC family protein [Chloroflexi bacterium]|nr:XdhC family protein [Chloroflexota bacterium]